MLTKKGRAKGLAEDVAPLCSGGYPAKAKKLDGEEVDDVENAESDVTFLARAAEAASEVDGTLVILQKEVWSDLCQLG